MFVSWTDTSILVYFFRFHSCTIRIYFYLFQSFLFTNFLYSKYQIHFDKKMWGYIRGLYKHLCLPQIFLDRPHIQHPLFLNIYEQFSFYRRVPWFLGISLRGQRRVLVLPGSEAHTPSGPGDLPQSQMNFITWIQRASLPIWSSSPFSCKASHEFFHDRIASITQSCRKRILANLLAGSAKQLCFSPWQSLSEPAALLKDEILPGSLPDDRPPIWNSSWSFWCALRRIRSTSTALWGNYGTVVWQNPEALYETIPLLISIGEYRLPTPDHGGDL